MKLLIDIGNTRIKWACIGSTGLTESQNFTRSKTGVKSLLNKHWKDLKKISSIYVSNVAGDKIAQQLTEWTEKQWQLTPTFIHSEAKRFGVTNSYSEPELLGVDRWLAMISARQHARQASCIIDCGTAITIDIVTKLGEHQGGMILPGLTLMREALTNNANNLNEVAEDSNFKTLAINTQSAIQAGTLYTVTASLERVIDDLNQQFDDRIRFIITGGDAEILMPLLPTSIVYYPDIVLKGLAYYARQDDKKNPVIEETTETVESSEVVEA